MKTITTTVESVKEVPGVLNPGIMNVRLL